MANNQAKTNYTIFLSLVFIGIGGYELYEKFVLESELPTYQWVLAIGLVLLGIYQLVTLSRKRNT
ncbi:hypothetical protein BST97_06180 [Nonlabens spongiae]|uniref:Uncharacterized protein n=1 Tax=Nonlabens spongiae TaxID=331648 RepID=A0A1W6MJ47_9FLAO|nr:hypothetical protein [Nonlabens spongiae]ARN77613.1 hypothetical protein BST97_06180 [Nonlabens spongiae]